MTGPKELYPTPTPTQRFIHWVTIQLYHISRVFGDRFQSEERHVISGLSPASCVANPFRLLSRRSEPSCDLERRRRRSRALCRRGRVLCNSPKSCEQLRLLKRKTRVRRLPNPRAAGVPSCRRRRRWCRSRALRVGRDCRERC